MKTAYTEIEAKNDKIITQLEKEFSIIRAGRANPAIIDRLMVDYYGQSTPINQVASVSVPDARTLLIAPWDAAALKDIEKAINASDIGITPNNDGKNIRLSFPTLTEERRHELVKEIHKYGEEAKVSIRNVRRESIEQYKDMKKKSEITEDDLKDTEKDLQELTDNFIKKIDETVSKKEKELMEV